MSNEKYVAPEMDIIEFGNEDLVCNLSGWTPDGNTNNGFDITEENPNNPYDDNDF